MNSDSEISDLITLMERFAGSSSHSAADVRELEGVFSLALDDDDRFENLQYALAMYGADGYDTEDQASQIAKECSWAIRTLKGVCVYRDCQDRIVDGTRFCVTHAPT